MMLFVCGEHNRNPKTHPSQTARRMGHPPFLLVLDRLESAALSGQCLWEFHFLKVSCMFGLVKSARQASCSTGPTTTHFISERFTISAAGISICGPKRAASAMVAPYTT